METKYYYPHNPRIRSLISRIIYGRGNASDIEELSKNFVLEDDIVLESKDKHSFDDTVAFLGSKSYYVARRTGFVYFNDNEIKIFPIVGTNDEKLFSYIIMPSGKFTNKQISPAKLREEIQRYNFKNPIPADFLRNAIQLFNQDGGYKIINQGAPMIPNRVDDIFLDERFNFKPLNFFYVGNSRQLSSSEISFYAKVEKGDHLGVFKHFIDGKDGEDVFGFSIEKTTINSYYQVGEGIDKNPSGHLHAELSGYLRIHLNGELQVRPARLIKEDVKQNIISDSEEDIILAGNVYPSTGIRVAGNLIILASVESIKIQCEGDLLIAGGINSKCEVQVSNNCVAQYIANSKLNCEKSVYISQYILNSEIKTKGDITVREREYGEIVGGEVSTENGSIETNTVGSVSGTATNLKVATQIEANKSKSLKNTLVDLEKEKVLLEANIQKVKPRIIMLYTKIKNRPNTVSDTERDTFKKSLLAYKKLIGALSVKNKEIEEVKEHTKVENSSKLGKHQIRIFNEVYGGVNIQIRNIKHFFKYNSFRPYLMCKHPVLPKIESFALKED